MKDISKLSASEYFYNALAVRKSAMEDIISWVGIHRTRLSDFRFILPRIGAECVDINRERNCIFYKTLNSTRSLLVPKLIELECAM